MGNITFNAGQSASKKKRAASSASKKSRSVKKKKSTPVPAVRYLRYELTNSGSAGTETSHYIDLARDLSAINRRLMRQGRAYHVKRISIVSSNTIPAPGQNAGRVTIGTAPDSWTVRNAWKRGFESWKMMHFDASKAAFGTLAGKYSDFKVNLSDDFRSATKLTPKDNGGNNLTLGEWNYATLVSPDGTTSADSFEVHLLGDHNGSAGAWTSVGLVKSYGASRQTVDNGQPYTPSTASDDPLVNLFDDGTVFDEVIQLQEDENDDPPYSRDGYAGGSSNHPKPIVVQQTTLGADGRASVGGFTAICGLLEIEATSPVANDVYSVLVELAPGNYRGIAADVI